MRPRYLLAAGPRAAGLHERLAARLAPQLPKAQRLGDASLFLAPGVPAVPLPAVDGWIIGSLFERDGSTPCVSLSSPDQLAVASTRGRHLIDRYSGRYVAIFREAIARPPTILRDPSAALPALLHRGAGFDLVCSDVELAERTGLVPLGIDWQSMAKFLRFPLLPSPTSCLAGVSEILPGQRCTLLERVVVEQLWSPGVSARSTTPATIGESAARVAAAVDAAVAGLAGEAGRVGLELSGGLDSAIVASALDRAGIAWTGLNLAPDAVDGDERSYARLVAQQSNMPLIELRFGSELFDPLATPTRLTPRPGGNAYVRGIDRLLQDASERHGLAKVFSGGGGDNVFCSLQSSAPVIDAWRTGGWPLAMTTLRNVAEVTQTTHWALGRMVARRLIRAGLRTWRWPASDRFLAREVRPEPDRHPWLAWAGAPGTRAHIAAILRIHPVLDAHDRIASGRVALPLLSQPVIEACLSVPTWQWFDQGRDRAVARIAFADRLPPAITRRQGKGRLDTLIVQSYDRNRKRIAELLCDGLLSGAGLLDRDAILDCLERPASAKSEDHSRILDLADAELWAESIARRQRIAGP